MQYTKYYNWINNDSRVVILKSIPPISRELFIHTVLKLSCEIVEQRKYKWDFIKVLICDLPLYYFWGTFDSSKNFPHKTSMWKSTMAAGLEDFFFRITYEKSIRHFDTSGTLQFLKLWNSWQRVCIKEWIEYLLWFLSRLERAY